MTKGTQHERRWWTLGAVCLSSALVWLAATDVNIVLPIIAKEFHAKLESLQWLVMGFTLAGIAVVAGGRMADIYGRRRILIIGIILLGVPSVVAALSHSIGVMIACRGFMGLGAALILPASLSIVSVSFEGAERKAALSIWIGTIWSFQALGPTVAGLVTSIGHWRWIFWDNLVFGILALLAILWSMKGERVERIDEPFDLGGLVTLSVSLLLFMLTLSLWQSFSVGANIGIAAGGLLFLALFLFIESKHSDPLVDLRLFRNAELVGGNAVNVLVNFSFSAVLFLMSIYLQRVLSYSPAYAGLLLLPATMTILIFTPLGAWLAHRFGLRWPTVAGMVLVTIGMVILSCISMGDQYLNVLPGFIVLGCGVGLIITAITQAAIDPVEPEQAGVASGIFKAGSMLGGTLGVAASMAVFQYVGSQKAHELLGPHFKFKEFQSASPHNEIFLAGMSGAMWLSAALSILAGLIALFLVHQRKVPGEKEG